MRKRLLQIALMLWFGSFTIFMAVVLNEKPVYLPGPRGIQGIQGIKGDKGDVGFKGVQGTQGKKGDIGTIGLQGIKGDSGYIDLPKLYNQVSPAVVWIGAEDEWSGEIKWQGTGFFVTPDLIATAGHMVKNTESFEVMFSDGSKAKADFVHAENIERCDVGFIRLRSEYRKDRPYLKFDIETEAGESTIILGYPWGSNETISITSGIVAAPKHKWYLYLKLSLFADIASYPGNSGSPVLDMDGEVIGILVSGPYANECYSMCTPARLVQLAMQKALAEMELMICP